MTELPPEAAALIERARRTHGPTQADRERVFAGLHASLATGAAGVLAASATANAAESAAITTPAAAGSKASALGWKALLSWKAGKVVLSTLALGGAIGLGAVSQRTAAPVARRDVHVSPMPVRTASAPQHAPAIAQPPLTSEEAAAEPRPVAPQREGAAPAGSEPTRRAARAVPHAPGATRDQSAEVATGAATSRVRTTRTRTSDHTRGSERAARTSSPRRESVRSAPVSTPLSPSPGSRSQRLDGAHAESAAGSESAPEPRSAAVVATDAALAPPFEGELTLLRRALTRLRDSDADGALTVLAEHATRYPAGALATERRGLRVVALCAAGLRDQGVREQRAFLAEAEATPIAERVRRACSEREP